MYRKHILYGAFVLRLGEIIDFKHCMKSNIFIKTLSVNIIFYGFSAIDGNIIYIKTKIKENITFSIISDIFRNKSIG